MTNQTTTPAGDNDNAQETALQLSTWSQEIALLNADALGATMQGIEADLGGAYNRVDDESKALIAAGWNKVQTLTDNLTLAASVARGAIATAQAVNEKHEATAREYSQIIQALEKSPDLHPKVKALHREAYEEGMQDAEEMMYDGYDFEICIEDGGDVLKEARGLDISYDAGRAFTNILYSPLGHLDNTTDELKAELIAFIESWSRRVMKSLFGESSFTEIPDGVSDKDWWANVEIDHYDI